MKESIVKDGRENSLPASNFSFKICEYSHLSKFKLFLKRVAGVLPDHLQGVAGC